MKKTLKNICIILMAVVVLVCSPGKMDVYADEEKTHFGSDSYEWTAGTVSPIGIYAFSSDAVSEVNLTVTYDPEMLQYFSGGELVEEGTVKISTSGLWVQEYMQMLHFIPKLSGNSKITIEASEIKTATGKTVSTEAVSVDVAVPAAEGCRLSGIKVNGKNISGFEPDKTDYTVEVDAEAQTAEITTEPAEIGAEISPADLKTGENKITIITNDSIGNRARYTVTVVRPEPVIQETVLQTQPQTEPVPQTDIPVESSKQTEFVGLAFIIGLVIVIILIFTLIVLKAIIEQKKRKRRRQRRMAAQSVQRRKKRAAASLPQQNPEEVLLKPDSANIQKSATATAVETDTGNLPVPVCEDEIVVDHVTMEFKREKDEATSIKELLIRTLRKQRSYEMFKALDDVSFSIKKGEVVGIIGTNGSGKSTILKIISGVLKPTKGSVKADRNKIQLLTLGTGFDYELTGRENVYLNGAIIGYTKDFIDDHYEEIVKFAELEGFMEEKVRNYSSGMVSRLGFAIATIRDTPEILILDEVLSVGDMFFRKKSEARIKEMIHGGSTVLIVSHSTSVIRSNCTKAVWIEKGILKMVGDPKEVCAAYEKMNE